MIKFRLEDGAKLPKRGSAQAAGLDICANELFTLYPGEQRLVKTDVFLADCPIDVYLRIAPRSKLAVRYGMDTLAGVVDSDYRGEVRVLLKNTGGEIASFRRGDAIAQLIPEKLALYSVSEVKHTSKTARGARGITDKDLRL